jgi:hypothetical protein
VVNRRRWRSGGRLRLVGDPGGAPSTRPSYTAVALPSVALVASDRVAGGWGGKRSDAGEYYRQRSGAAPLTGGFPWLVIVIAGATLETVRLLRGGRSSTFPTLSTTVDQLVGTHRGRFVLIGVWLWVGFSPVRRLLAHGHAGGD